MTTKTGALPKKLSLKRGEERRKKGTNGKLSPPFMRRLTEGGEIEVNNERYFETFCPTREGNVSLLVVGEK